MGSETESVDGESRTGRARWALAHLAEMEPELRAAALFPDEGEPGPPLAATGDPEWVANAATLIRTVRDSTSGEFDSAHIALDEGEVFVVAEAGFVVAFTTARFVLAALTRFDARMCLRDLARSISC